MRDFADYLQDPGLQAQLEIVKHIEIVGQRSSHRSDLYSVLYDRC